MLTLSDATPIPTLSEAHRRILRPFIEPVVLEAPFFVDFPIDLALTQKKKGCSCLTCQTQGTVPLVLSWRIWNMAFSCARRTMMHVNSHSVLFAPLGTHVSL